MTDEEKRQLREELRQWKKQNADVYQKYRQMNSLWNQYDMDPREEKKARYGLIDTYYADQAVSNRLFTLFKKCDNDQDAIAIFKEEKLFGLALDTMCYSVEKAAHNSNQIRQLIANYLIDETEPEKAFRYTSLYEKPDDLSNANNQIDETLTGDQADNLRKIRKYMLEMANHDGFEIMGSDGDIKNFVNEFLSQPVSVQMMAIYLVNTDKRKCPDPLGMDAVEAMSKDNTMDFATFKKKIEQHPIKRVLKLSKLDGSHLYWNKLEQAFGIAKKNAVKIEKFRKTQREEMSLIPNGNERAAKLEEMRDSFKARALETLIDREKLQEQIDVATQVQEHAIQFRDSIQQISNFETDIRERGRHLTEEEKQQYTGLLVDVVQQANTIKTLCDRNAAIAKRLEDYKVFQGVDWVKKQKEYIDGPRDLYNAVNLVSMQSSQLAYCIEKGTLFTDPVANKEGKKIFSLAGLLPKLIYGNSTSAPSTSTNVEPATDVKPIINTEPTTDAAPATSGESAEAQTKAAEDPAATYNGVTDMIQFGINGIGHFLNGLTALRDLKKWGDRSYKQNAENVLDVLGAGAGVGLSHFQAATSSLKNFRNIAAESEIVQKYNLLTQSFMIATNTIKFVKDCYHTFKDITIRRNASALRERLKDYHNPKLSASVRTVKKRSKWKIIKNVVSTAISATAVVGSILALPALGLGVGIGAVAGVAGFAATKLVFKFHDMYAKRAARKKAVDTALLKTKADLAHLKAEGQRISDTAVSVYKNHMEEKKLRFNQNSEERKQLEKHLNSDHAIKRTVRRYETAKAGALNPNSYAKSLMKQTVREAVLHVFFKDPKAGFVETNLLSKEEFANRFKNLDEMRNTKIVGGPLSRMYQESKLTRQRIDYYDFLKMAGVKMKMPNHKEAIETLKSISIREEVANKALG